MIAVTYISYYLSAAIQRVIELEILARWVASRYLSLIYKVHAQEVRFPPGFFYRVVVI